MNTRNIDNVIYKSVLPAIWTKQSKILNDKSNTLPAATRFTSNSRIRDISLSPYLSIITIKKTDRRQNLMDVNYD